MRAIPRSWRPNGLGGGYLGDRCDLSGKEGGLAPALRLITQVLKLIPNGE
jgi:hypothetical protein